MFHLGWRKAVEAARDALTAAASDNSGDSEKFRRDLLNIAHTTFSSKILHQHEGFAQLAVDAVLRLKGSTNLEAIKVLKRLGGSLSESYLDEGFLLEKKVCLNQLMIDFVMKQTGACTHVWMSLWVTVSSLHTANFGITI